MKTTSIFSLALLSALTAGAFAQGSLTPPAGAPAPVFKTLNQVEARTPVNTLSGDATAVHIITVPGSYYLTGPITGNTAKAAIRIEAVNVTLDLNGFTIDAVVGSTAGISANAPGGPLVVRNGMIRSFNPGIDISNSTQFLLQDVQVVSPQGIGVKLDGHGTAERVSVVNGRNYGIQATATSRVQIRDCRVDGIVSASAGISAQIGEISGCSVGDVTGSAPYGILCASGTVDSSTVRRVVGSSGSSYAVGISASAISRCCVADVSNPSFGSRGVYGGKSVRDTVVSDISGGSVGVGIDTVQLVENCDVTAVTGGSSSATGIQSCAEVLNSRVSGMVHSGGSNTRGIIMPAYGRAVGNRLHNSGNTGIQLDDYSIAEGNRISTTGGAGTAILVPADVPGARVIGNHMANVSTGIEALNVKSLVVRNTVTQISSSYFNVHAGVTVVNSTALGTNPNANIAQ